MGRQKTLLAVMSVFLLLTTTSFAQRHHAYGGSWQYLGQAHVDGRAFAFTDVQQRDWYMHDAGAHWPAMRLSFHRTGP